MEPPENPGRFTLWFSIILRDDQVAFFLPYYCSPLACREELGSPALETGGIRSLVDEAPYIFSGEVLESPGSTVEGLGHPERAAIVRVENTYQAPALLADLNDQRVTVLSDATRAFRRGGRYLFFCRPWAFGRGIAVREIRSTRLPRREAGVLDTLVSEVRQRPDRRLQESLAAADLVVSGRVSEVVAKEVTAKEVFISEHSPNWRRAIVEVETVEKGSLAPGASALTLYFPASRDVMWLAIPKPRPGQEAIWILTALTGNSVAEESFAALHRYDVRPLAELSRIRRLIGEIE